jgi:hypothetical protein
MSEPGEWVRVVGSNADVDTVAEDLLAAGGAVNWPAAAAATTVVSGSADDAAAGTGARTVQVGGLLAGGVLAVETVTLNGATPVACANNYLRVLPHLCRVLTAGSGATNAGILSVKHSSTTLVTVPVGEGRANGAFFTVPAGRRARLREATLVGGVTTAGTLTGRVWVRPAGGVWQQVDVWEVTASIPGATRRDYQGSLLLEPLTDVRLEAAGSVNNMVGFGALLASLESAF